MELEINKTYLVQIITPNNVTQITCLQVTQSSYLLEFMDGHKKWVLKDKARNWTMLEEIQKL